MVKKVWSFSLDWKKEKEIGRATISRVLSIDSLRMSLETYGEVARVRDNTLTLWLLTESYLRTP